MKAEIHPAFHLKAKAKCSSCGAVYEIPSTMEAVTVEVCRSCSPAYTGKAQQEAKGGRVERFRKRMAKAKKG